MLVKKMKKSIKIIVLGSFIFIVGCSSINPKPISKFSSSLQNVKSGMDSALSIDYEWNKDGFINGFASDTDSKLSSLKIIFPTGTNGLFEFTDNKKQIYLELKKLRPAVYELNSCLYSYSQLLVALTDDSLVSVDEFETMAKELNANLNKTYGALGLDVDSKANAIISTAAAEAARLYIEYKRKSYFIDFINNNQQNIETYSNHCIQLIDIIYISLKRSYPKMVEPLEEEWQAAKNVDKRIKITEEMLSINEKLIDMIATLKELKDIYIILPKAHKDLAKAVEYPDLNPAGITELYNSGQRLYRIYTQLLSENS